MEWTDDALVLSARRLGDSGMVAVLLTRDHGRHAGLVAGGQSRRHRALLEPGSQVRCRWRSRLADQLGAWSLEPVRAVTAGLLDQPLPLAAALSALTLMDVILAEREAHPGLFDATLALFEALSTPLWGEVYVRWEVGLLAEVGYGLDLGACALTGTLPADGNDHLAYVSPRTGRAVSLSAGEPYRDKLLALPGFLIGRGGGGAAEVAAGLALTGHFLERHVLAQRQLAMPPARLRLAERQGRDPGRVPARDGHGGRGNGTPGKDDTISGSVAP